MNSESILARRLHISIVIVDKQERIMRDVRKQIRHVRIYQGIRLFYAHLERKNRMLADGCEVIAFTQCQPVLAVRVRAQNNGMSNIDGTNALQHRRVRREVAGPVGQKFVIGPGPGKVGDQRSPKLRHRRSTRANSAVSDRHKESRLIRRTLHSRHEAFQQQCVIVKDDDASNVKYQNLAQRSNSMD